MAGAKHDDGKPRYSLLPWDALAAFVDVLEYGAREYGAHSWSTVPDGIQRYTDAAQRHLAAILRGEQTDPDSKLSHWAHIGVNALFVLALQIRGGRKLTEFEAASPPLFDGPTAWKVMQRGGAVQHGTGLAFWVRSSDGHVMCGHGESAHNREVDWHRERATWREVPRPAYADEWPGRRKTLSHAEIEEVLDRGGAVDCDWSAGKAREVWYRLEPGGTLMFGENKSGVLVRDMSLNKVEVPRPAGAPPFWPVRAWKVGDEVAVEDIDEALGAGYVLQALNSPSKFRRRDGQLQRRTHGSWVNMYFDGPWLFRKKVVGLPE